MYGSETTMLSTKKRLLRSAAVGVIVAFGFPDAAYAACGGSAWAKPYGWGPVSSGRQARLGHPGYEQQYKWNHGGNVETYVCVQARGFDENGNEHWYAPGGVGCGKGGGSGTVPWGNNAAIPKFRARSAGPNGVVVAWRCD
jgi:hypothetical protein